MNEPMCAWCEQPAKGFALIGSRRYCHEGEPPTCFERAQWADSSARVESDPLDLRVLSRALGLANDRADRWQARCMAERDVIEQIRALLPKERP